MSKAFWVVRFIKRVMRRNRHFPIIGNENDFYNLKFSQIYVRKVVTTPFVDAQATTSTNNLMVLHHHVCPQPLEGENFRFCLMVSQNGLEIYKQTEGKVRSCLTTALKTRNHYFVAPISFGFSSN